MPGFDLQDEIQALQDIDHYHIENEHDVASMDIRAVAVLLEGVPACR